MKKLLLLALAAVGLVAARRARASRNDADLWQEATRQPDLR